jgi:uncharacterized protein (PEP-CTERM system associated)
LLRWAFFALGIFAQGAVAAPLVTSVGLLSRLVFTDNLFLTNAGAVSGTAAQSPALSAGGQRRATNQGREFGTILQLLPNIAGGGGGSRSSYRFFYGPSAVFYGEGHSDLDRIFHVLQANASVTVIDGYFSLQLSANANQNLVDPNVGNAGFTALGNPDAFGQTASIQITPVFAFPVLRGNFATVQFAPGINYVFAAKTAGGTDNSGTTGSQSSLTITSGDYFSRMPWQIAASSNVFNVGNSSGSDYGTGSGSGTSTVSGTVTYPISDQWQIQGLIGYDWGNYDSLAQPDGLRWRVTPYWSPSRNTTIGLGYGYRFFGADYYANIQHRHRKTVVTASYEINVTNARTAILNSNAVNFQDPYGEPITNPLASQTLSGSIANPALTSGFFIQNQLLLGITSQFGRTSVSLNVNNWHWDYQATGNQVDQNQGTLTFSRTLSPRSSASLSLQYWTYNQSAGVGADFSQISVATGYTYQVSRRTQGSATYTFSQQDSATSSQNFGENQLWLTLNWSM